MSEFRFFSAVCVNLPNLGKDSFTVSIAVWEGEHSFHVFFEVGKPLLSHWSCHLQDGGPHMVNPDGFLSFIQEFNFRIFQKLIFL